MKNLKKMLALLLSVVLLLGCAAPAFAEEATEPDAPAKAEDLPLIDFEAGFSFLRDLVLGIKEYRNTEEGQTSLQEIQQMLRDINSANDLFQVLTGITAVLVFWSPSLLIPLLIFFPRIAQRWFGKTLV